MSVISRVNTIRLSVLDQFYNVLCAYIKPRLITYLHCLVTPRHRLRIHRMRITLTSRWVLSKYMALETVYSIVILI